MMINNLLQIPKFKGIKSILILTSALLVLTLLHSNIALASDNPNGQKIEAMQCTTKENNLNQIMYILNAKLLQARIKTKHFNGVDFEFIRELIKCTNQVSELLEAYLDPEKSKNVIVTPEGLALFFEVSEDPNSLNFANFVPNGQEKIGDNLQREFQASISRHQGLAESVFKKMKIEGLIQPEPKDNPNPDTHDNFIPNI
jgi:hypothetical protein